MATHFQDNPPSQLSHYPQTESPESIYKVTKKRSKYADFMQAYKVRTPKYKFYVERGGNPDHPVILLIMGLGAQSLAWPNNFCKLLIEAGFHVIRFDNRDIGKSSKLRHKNTLTKHHQTPLRQALLISQFKLGVTLPKLPRTQSMPVPYDLYDMAEDAHQLLNALNIKQCNVLGMSMGGMIAQILAANYPERVSRLGLLSTSNNRALLPTPNFKYLRHAAKPTPHKSDKDAVLDHAVDMLRVLGSPDHFNEEETRNRLQTLYERRFYPKGTARQQLAIFATGSLTQLNARIHQPTIIVHGTQDNLFSPAHANALAKSIPHASLHMIEGLGHDIPLALSGQLSKLFIHHFSAHTPS